MGYQTPKFVALHIVRFPLAGRAAGAGFSPKRTKLGDLKKEKSKSVMYLNEKINRVRNKSVGRRKSGDQIGSVPLLFQFQALTFCLEPYGRGLMLRVPCGR